MTQPTSAIKICEAFLIAMEKRDLDLARSFVAPEALRMVFPGGANFSSIEEMVAGAATRYRFVGKHFDRRESWATAGGESVLIAGTLYGEWLDGTTFEGIRFIDVFDLRNDKIWRQHVWNDMGEYKLKAMTAQG